MTEPIDRAEDDKPEGREPAWAALFDDGRFEEWLRGKRPDAHQALESLTKAGCKRAELLDCIRRIAVGDLAEPLSRSHLNAAVDAMWNARDWISAIQDSDIRRQVEVSDEYFEGALELLNALIGAVRKAQPRADRRATRAKDAAKTRLDEIVVAAAGKHCDAEVALLVDAAAELYRHILDPSGFASIDPPPWTDYTEAAHVQWRFRHGRTTKRKPATKSKAGRPASEKRLKGSGKTAQQKGRLHHRRPHGRSRKP